MTQEDYIKTHPEKFEDDIDKWLFSEFGIIGGCCSAEKSHEYHIARMVAEKLNDAFIDKAAEWLYLQLNEINMEGEDMENFLKDFGKYMKGK